VSLFDIGLWVWLTVVMAAFLAGYLYGLTERFPPWWRRLLSQIRDAIRARRERVEEWRRSQNGGHRPR